MPTTDRSSLWSRNSACAHSRRTATVVWARRMQKPGSGSRPTLHSLLPSTSSGPFRESMDKHSIYL
jgi:hypothetical protein